MRDVLVSTALFIAAIPAGVAPRRYWRELDVYLPISRAALLSAIATVFLGAAIGIPAYLRKPEWDAGAIVVTDDKWFKLGVPAERDMPGGLRTLYPLTELHHHEVLRRAVRYTLPPLKGTRPPAEKT